MKRLILAGMLSLLFCASADAEVKDPLLQKLIEKGTITNDEAEEIQSKKTELPPALKGLSIGALAYFDYSFGEKSKNNTHFNEFALNRGYINIRKEITPWFKARITPDIFKDATNGYVLRMKYYYADFLPKDLGPVTDNDVRVGMGQIPWIDFEEAINIYRMQGTMFQERFGSFSSADLGVGILGNFGGALSKEAQESVGYSTPYSGRYGTYHLGVFNGGGYTKTSDTNENKVFEGRISIRPLPDIIPGLQFTYFGVQGKGNASTSPTWNNNTGFISYQMKYLVLTAEYVHGKGQQDGSDTRKKGGYSFFADIRDPFYEKASLFARYDTWDPDTNRPNDKQFLTIIGAGYKIYGNNYLIAAYEKTHYQPVGQSAGVKDDKKGQVVLQLAF